MQRLERLVDLRERLPAGDHRREDAAGSGERQNTFELHWAVSDYQLSHCYAGHANLPTVDRQLP